MSRASVVPAPLPEAPKTPSGQHPAVTDCRARMLSLVRTEEKAGELNRELGTYLEGVKTPVPPAPPIQPDPVIVLRERRPMQLKYRSGVMIEDLRANECTIRPCADGNGARWWNLWLYVYRDDRPTELEAFEVPVSPRGPYTESGPGGRTWGLADAGNGSWQVSPSINVLADEDGRAAEIHPCAHPTRPSIWHQTPTIVGVPAGEPWQ